MFNRRIGPYRANGRTERLSLTLLASISHDLKTPLAAIYGAATMLRNRSSIVEDRESADLISIIIDESERLNRFINGLFDITKLESGATMPNIARHDIAEVVGSALHRGAKIIADHHIEVELASGLQTVDLDAVLFEQVLFNLLDNAAKYSPKGTTITIWGRRHGFDLLRGTRRG
jgi:two-component system sensor histidine kinase KdpD